MLFLADVLRRMSADGNKVLSRSDVNMCADGNEVFSRSAVRRSAADNEDI